MSDLYHYVNPANGKVSPMISNSTYEFIIKNKDTLDNAINYDKDFDYQYFGFKTLERSYLLKLNGKVSDCWQLKRISLIAVVLSNFLDCIFCPGSNAVHIVR